MFRKLSTRFGKSKKEEANGIRGTNGTNGTHGTHGTNGPSDTTTTTPNGANGDTPTKLTLGKRNSSFAPFKAKKETTDHSASRGDVESSFEQFAQLIHASQRPLPTQSGDGAYMDKEPPGLLSDIRALGFKDVRTLMDVMKTKAKGELQDDKTYLMEHTIQASYLSQGCCHTLLTHS